MKKIWLILILTVAIQTRLNAQGYPGQEKNNITYRPFKEWSKIVLIDSITQKKIQIYFPKMMEHIAQKSVPHIQKTVKKYSETLYREERFVPLTDSAKATEKTKRSRIKNFFGFLFPIYPFLKDSTGKLAVQKQNFLPQEIIIVLYPTMQDFNQQKIVPFIFFPPGILGFTENYNNRIALPYGGDWHEFELTLSHELNHNFYNVYSDSLRQELKKAKKFKSFEEWPLWFTEGSSDYAAELILDSLGNYYREAATNELILVLMMSDQKPDLTNLNRQFDITPYAYGKSFLTFMFERVGHSPYATMMRLRAESVNFEDAWNIAFNENLKISQEKWWRSLKLRKYEKSLIKNADSLKQKPLCLNSFREIIGGRFSYDNRSKTLVYYGPDEDWGAAIYALKIDNGVKLPILRQFQDGTLFFRMDNAPAIYDSLVAVSVSKEGRDVIQIYQLNFDDKKIKKKDRKKIGRYAPGSDYESHEDTLINARAECLKEISLSERGILWISDLKFESDCYLLFIGMDTLGENNIYFLDWQSSKIYPLTRNSYDKHSPHFFVDGFAYIMSDSNGYRMPVYEKNEQIYQLVLPEPGFADRLAVHDSLLAFRMLYKDGTSKIFFWKHGENNVYEYIYGSQIDFDTTGTTHFRGYPLADELLCLRSETLLIYNSDIDNLTSERLKIIDLNWNALKLKPITFWVRNAHMKADTTHPLPVLSADKKLRFLGMFGWDLALSDAVGERNFIFNLQFGYNTYSGLMGYGLAGLYDLSGHTMRYYSAILSRGYRFHNPDPIRKNSYTYDVSIQTMTGWIWPLNFKRKIELGIGLGYLNRRYLKNNTLNPYGSSDNGFEARGFKTMTFSGLTRYVYDGAYVDHIRATRLGNYYMMSYNATLDKNKQLIESSAMFDIRNYWKPWQSTTNYFASRLSGGAVLGKDGYWFWLPALYQTPGFMTYDFSQMFGSRFLVLQNEFRINLVRWFMLSHQFWKNPQPIILLSNSVSVFNYLGVVQGINKYQYADRYGFRFRTSVIFVPIYLVWERYSYTNKYNWHSAWTLEFEY